MNCDDTLSLCEHGAPGKLGCSLCVCKKELNERIDKLQNYHANIINQCLNRLGDLEKDLESFREANIVDNEYSDEQIRGLFKNANERIDKLESSNKYNKEYSLEIHQEIIRLMESFINLEEKIKELEKGKSQASVCAETFIKAQIKMDEICEKIKTLEGSCELLRERVNANTGGLLGLQHKTPYKCPVCDGKRRELNVMPNGGYFESECKSCEGKGILWG